MLWRGIDLSTFDVETLRGWIADLEGEKLTIQAEIGGRPGDPPTVVDKRTGRPFQRVGSPDRPIDPGAPPRRDEGEG